MSSQANSQTVQNQACLTVYGTCSKYQDDVPPAISACDQNPSALNSKLKSLTQNQNLVNSVQAALAALATKVYAKQSIPSYTCADVVSFTNQLLDLMENNPASTSIADVAEKIINATRSAVCTASELKALEDLNADIDSTESVFDTAIDDTQGTLEGRSSLIKCKTQCRDRANNHQNTICNFY